MSDLRTAARGFAATNVALSADGRRMLLHPLRAAPSAQHLFQSISLALAEAASALYPAWYDGTPGKGLTGGSDGAPQDIAAAAEASGASPAWLARAIRRVEAGELPLPLGFPPIETARQLGFILAPKGLCVVLAVEEADGAGAASLFLPHMAPWLAESCDWGVGLLFSDTVPMSGAFERIRHGAVHFAAERAPGPAEGPESGTDDGKPGVLDDENKTEIVSTTQEGTEATGILWPVVGHPNPLSPAEQKLARLLEADAGLKGLFAFNMPVRTFAGSTYLVDLLWAQGDLVVEVDGYGPHSSRTAFARDRHRDFELHATRYRVLRLTHDEVMRADTPALFKIRKMITEARMAGTAPT